MAMEANLSVDGNLVAGADLTAKQYTFCKLNTSGQAIGCSVVGEIAYGVLQNDPAQGSAAMLAYAGITKVTAGGTIAANAPVATNATGLAVAAATGNYILGIARNGGVAGDVISILLTAEGRAP
jgi:hypothetical protein